MNYHLMIDDKFFDNLIDDIENVSSPGLNRYLIRGSKTVPTYVTHVKAEWPGNIFDWTFTKLLRSVTNRDRIFIYWYDIHIGKLMLTIPRDIPLYVAVTGGDFYDDPPLYHRNLLYDKLTLRYVNRRYLYPHKWARRPQILAKQISEIYEKIKRLRKDFEIKVITVQRIDYLLIGDFMTDELMIISKLYQTTNFQRLPFIYDQNFDLALSFKKELKNTATVNIQVGNSATDTNNHVDILKHLKHFVKEDIKILLPLAYGDEDYGDFVKKSYKSVFADKVIFQSEFVTRESYITKLNEIDICIMNHNRSQALGNCITILTMGKKLYLKEHNPLWSMFKQIGVKIFSVDTIKNISFDEFKQALTPEQAQSNIEKLSTSFSEKKRLEYLSNLLN